MPRRHRNASWPFVPLPGALLRWLRQGWMGQWCKRCGRNAESFYVPDDVWNTVTGGFLGCLCFACFDWLARRRGLRFSVWMVRPE